MSATQKMSSGWFVVNKTTLYCLFLFHIGLQNKWGPEHCSYKTVCAVGIKRKCLTALLTGQAFKGTPPLLLVMDSRITWVSSRVERTGYRPTVNSVNNLMTEIFHTKLPWLESKYFIFMDLPKSCVPEWMVSYIRCAYSIEQNNQQGTHSRIANTFIT